MACSIKNAPPTEAAVNKLLSKVGGTLEQALNSQELKWSSKLLDADDAHVVAYVVALSTVLQKLVLGANFIGDAGASSIAEAPAPPPLFPTPRHPHAPELCCVYPVFCTSPLTTDSTLRNCARLQALKVNDVLKTLVLGSLLGGNNIGDRGAIAIAEALKTNVALQELYLSDGLIRDEGAMALAEGLKVNGVRSLQSTHPL